MKIAFKLLIMIFTMSCVNNDLRVAETKKFSPPTIIIKTTYDSIAPYQNEFISSASAELYGKFTFSDTLHFINEENFYANNQEYYFDDSLIGQTDSTRTDGLELIADYKTEIPIRLYHPKIAQLYFPVYLVNQTPNPKALLAKDGHIFGIQEAMDKDGYWRPIEGRGNDFCGRGYFGLTIKSQEFATILFSKYSGSFKTKIRIRIKNGDNIFVSQPFEGYINESQMKIEDESYFYYELKNNKASAIEYLFYGAKPLGTDDDNFRGLHATHRFGR